MTETIFLVIVVLFLVLIFYARREAGKHGTSAKEEFVGICKSAVETASQKEERKQRIMTLLGGNEIPSPSGAPFTKGEWGNAEIRKTLGVSSRTAVRYLDELEKEGKVKQVGKIGHAVTYRLK
ncbi:MAG: hypothetical protein UV20_C0021G0013 [Candidatus Magasanikbacteria bacterium GW2011_GWA2_42_32]|uniref:Helix-turn-helix type 11 domain-containing protein n=2 Tax=Parcubacteria group TaxID=1794811 RepID=A0A0G1A461_9BACT|nr:MAG: hypothetical protein UV20_C0021G0013 [Candidatus Magasanikbacteria bacterium GW2011_GWA2_42_32]OGZ00580.1 MAG: hypothetical protein A3B13_00975 [Candidatus Liptonbacteria bacterium RIFCSPLOWO2_01_FULL_45_15]